MVVTPQNVIGLQRRRQPSAARPGLAAAMRKLRLRVLLLCPLLNFVYFFNCFEQRQITFNFQDNHKVGPPEQGVDIGDSW